LLIVRISHALRVGMKINLEPFGFLQLALAHGFLYNKLVHMNEIKNDAEADLYKTHDYSYYITYELNQIIKGVLPR
jgi:hypothetical protein